MSKVSHKKEQNSPFNFKLLPKRHYIKPCQKKDSYANQVPNSVRPKSCKSASNL